MSADDGRPAFVSPYLRSVRCYRCGDGIDPADASGIDVSGPEFPPWMEPICPDCADDLGGPGVPCW